MKKYMKTMMLFVIFALAACQTNAPAVVPPTKPAPSVAPEFTVTPSARSGNGVEQVTLIFSNQINEMLKINWVNFDGVEEFFADLSPLSSNSITTYNTHVWRIRDESRNLIGEIVATRDAIQAYQIGQDKTISTASVDITVPVLDERAYIDRPDDVSGQYQVHFLYVLPLDEQDFQRDLDGKMDITVEAVNNWFLQQSDISKIRFDTYQGKLDITFVQLNMTSQQIHDASVTQYGGAYWIRDILESELVGMNIFQPGKIYVSLFEINKHPSTCADGAHPDDLMGRMAGLYPSAVLDSGYRCDSEDFGAGNSYADMGVVHEIIHLLGYAASCGKNPTSPSNFSHTGDVNSDLMWAPNDSSTQYWDTDHMQLDPGNDDYFNHDIPNCPDLADSVFLEPLPANPQTPPNWPANWKLP